MINIIKVNAIEKPDGIGRFIEQNTADNEKLSKQS